MNVCLRQHGLSSMFFVSFSGMDIVLVGSIFTTVAVAPAGDASLPHLMGSFHLKSVLFYGFAAKVLRLSVLNWCQRPHIKVY